MVKEESYVLVVLVRFLELLNGDQLAIGLVLGLEYLPIGPKRK